MDISAWIGDAFLFCRANPLIAGGALALLAALVRFRPRAVGRLAAISLAVIVLIYIGAYIGKATGVGVESKIHLTTDKNRE